MFIRMIRGLLLRQWKKMILIALTVALGASLASAMLSVMLDIGDKINQELKTYGANITVTPKETAVLDNLYDVEDGGEELNKSYLKEEELPEIKAIFWAFNIVDYAPLLEADVTVNGEDVTVMGSWFDHHMSLSTGEELDAGISSLRNWWDIQEGEWLSETDENAESECMVGVTLAEELGVSVGDVLTLTGSAGTADVTVVGIYDAGGDEDEYIFTILSTAQALAGLEGKVDSIEVSALTTPDNELSEQFAKDPDSLTQKQYETWYCTAYTSSICYQISEVISDSTASPVRQVADSEGNILDKTQLLMILITILSLVGSALGITNLVTASVMERAREFGLMKSIGAQNKSVVGLVLTEIMITSLIGGAAGFLMGVGFAQIIGHSVFNSAIEIRTMVIPIVALAVIAITVVGSLPAIRMLLKLRPTEVLHER